MRRQNPPSIQRGRIFNGTTLGNSNAVFISRDIGEWRRRAGRTRTIVDDTAVAGRRGLVVLVSTRGGGGGADPVGRLVHVGNQALDI